MRDEFENLTSEEMLELKELAAQEKRNYAREWQRKNRDKVKIYKERTFLRKALKKKQEMERKISSVPECEA